MAFAVSALISFVSTPIVALIARKYHAIDKPSGRKIHKKEIPLWGGLAVFAGVFASVQVLKWINPVFSEFYYANSGYIKQLIEGIFVGSLFILILGMVDDISGLRPTTKLLGQCAAAMIVMLYGLKIQGLSMPYLFNYWDFPIYLSIAATVFWVFLFSNSINIIDGIDGLATGVVAIAAFVFIIINYYHTAGQSDPQTVEKLKLASVLSAVLCGSCIGFLKFNFPPAKIFLGDSGSLLLGYLAAIIAMTGILKKAATFTLILPLIIFGFPIFDAFISALRRILSRKSFMEADRDHIHHKLLYKRGWSPTKVLMRLYAVTILLGAVAVLISIL